MFSGHVRAVDQHGNTVTVATSNSLTNFRRGARSQHLDIDAALFGRDSQQSEIERGRVVAGDGDHDDDDTTIITTPITTDGAYDDDDDLILGGLSTSDCVKFATPHLPDRTTSAAGGGDNSPIGDGGNNHVGRSTGATTTSPATAVYTDDGVCILNDVDEPIPDADRVYDKATASGQSLSMTFQKLECCCHRTMMTLPPNLITDEDRLSLEVHCVLSNYLNLVRAQCCKHAEQVHRLCATGNGLSQIKKITFIMYGMFSIDKATGTLTLPFYKEFLHNKLSHHVDIMYANHFIVFLRKNHS